MIKAPEFWQNRNHVLARLLHPLGVVYGAFVALRLMLAFAPYRSRLKIICVGNPTVGGVGKTPVVQALCLMVQKMGHRPVVLMRGYGGSVKGPVWVDPAVHSAADVGDEALLLAATLRVCVARNRVAGAQHIEQSDATVIVMDDGFQNPSLFKDLSFWVVDGAVGFGNGKIFPAGPLRECPVHSAQRAQAMIVFHYEPGVWEKYQLPILPASLRFPDVTTRSVAGRNVYGFAGIGRPEKFAQSLIAAGARLVGFNGFADHHVYRDAELNQLLSLAHLQQAELVTTVKDWVRLPPAFQTRIRPLPIELFWQDESAVATLLKRGIA